MEVFKHAGCQQRRIHYAICTPDEQQADREDRRAGNVNRVAIRPKETSVILQRLPDQMPYAVIQAQVPSSDMVQAQVWLRIVG